MEKNQIIKKEASTNPAFGKAPEKRSIKELLDYGIVVVDKPKGPTTHQVADYVKKILQIKKCGHSGSLDPAVTGVVAIGLGISTKVVHALLKAPKEYVCLMHLHKPVDGEAIRKTINSFVGKIKQMPPVKSAVKRQLREKNVYYINILEMDGQDVLFVVGCEAGTYIRTLCHDIGKSLKIGAHMAELRRTKVGNLGEDLAVTLQDLQDAFVFYNEGNDSELGKMLHPMEDAISHLPKMWVLDTTVDSLCHGASLNIPGISKLDAGIKENDFIAIMTLKDELVAFGNARMDSGKIEKEEKGTAATLARVFMQPGTYPKITK